MNNCVFVTKHSISVKIRLSLKYFCTQSNYKLFFWSQTRGQVIFTWKYRLQLKCVCLCMCLSGLQVSPWRLSSSGWYLWKSLCRGLHGSGSLMSCTDDRPGWPLCLPFTSSSVLTINQKQKQQWNSFKGTLAVFCHW